MPAPADRSEAYTRGCRRLLAGSACTSRFRAASGRSPSVSSRFQLIRRHAGLRGSVRRMLEGGQRSWKFAVPPAASASWPGTPGFGIGWPTTPRERHHGERGPPEREGLRGRHRHRDRPERKPVRGVADEGSDLRGLPVVAETPMGRSGAPPLRAVGAGATTARPRPYGAPRPGPLRDARGGHLVQRHRKCRCKHRRELRKRGVKPVIARCNTQHGSGLGELRCVVERTFAWLHSFRRLRIRWERLPEIHEAFMHLACAVVCQRHLGCWATAPLTP
jgi:hypothetical protein